ncbi:hypothetical protein PIB30_078812 [Stylosanthes scabra]|uniref:Uncharacterized protein n=1 Tax=Stylosanthes scabra TaxID=79078 RepID=A0ABU6XNY2_9FABA|nr:hypothetical protein [Stylosanthes scabra]
MGSVRYSCGRYASSSVRVVSCRGPVIFGGYRCCIIIIIPFASSSSLCIINIIGASSSSSSEHHHLRISIGEYDIAVALLLPQRSAKWLPSVEVLKKLKWKNYAVKLRSCKNN